MGATCTGGDCAVVVEDCTNKSLSKRPYDFWYDCAGQHLGQAESAASRDRDGDANEVLAGQELEVQLLHDHFAIHKMGNHGPRNDWRRKYALGRELGAGQTGIVFEAFAVTPVREDALGGRPLPEKALDPSPRSLHVPPGGLAVAQATSPAQAAAVAAAQQAAAVAAAAAAQQAVAPGQRRSIATATQVVGVAGAGGVSSPVPTVGRRVALKRFYSQGTSMFRHELKALTAVGVHPHVLRLLESFEGGGNGDDVLVLEHCDGGDLYELYAANHGCCMMETFVAKIIRQLLLALQHLVDRGIEHRDVKPENLLLYGANGYSSRESAAVPHLKLADFGWAVLVQQPEGMPEVPAGGVGSLWYAPPELNPPVDGAPQAPLEGFAPGSSDMWSVGIITYLLLIGHSPFNIALRVSDPAARESEVIRLAGMGQINTSTRPWACLSEDARNFVALLIQPDPSLRLSPTAAWNHPFVAKTHSHVGGDATVAQPLSALALGEGRAEHWGQLDGLQRLSWLAIARAITEPEMVEIQVLDNFISQQSIGGTMYLEQLAVQLVAAASAGWFKPRSVWSDVMVLAFNYLDADGDGFLGVGDLTHHLEGEDARECAEAWISKWRLTRESTRLNFVEFHRALLTAQQQHYQQQADTVSAGYPQMALPAHKIFVA